MQKEGDYIKISVVVCTYSKELFSETIECINSLSAQNYVNKEILLVMNKNDELNQMLLSGVPKSVKILINTNPGLSEARNLGIQNADGDVIAFIDDDAVADDQYLSNLIKNYEDEKVIGVVGKILPMDFPKYPDKLYWVGGFTYKGFPEKRCEVKNVHGCNMSFRREVFEWDGMFDVNLVRGRKLVTVEETEFSIRVMGAFPGNLSIYGKLQRGS